MKITLLTVSVVSLSMPLVSCYSPATFTTGIAQNSSYANNPDAASNHRKFSKSYADKNITVGVDSVLTIPIKFGTPVYETKDSNGDLVWVYQAITSTHSLQSRSADSFSYGFNKGSSTSALEIMSETGKRTTTLKIAFRKNGKVKNHKSSVSLG